MAFIPQTALESMGFKYLGRNVRISDRAAIHNLDQIEIGHNSRVDDFCVISGKVKIGRNVHIAVFCNVAGGTEEPLAKGALRGGFFAAGGKGGGCGRPFLA